MRSGYSIGVRRITLHRLLFLMAGTLFGLGRLIYAFAGTELSVDHLPPRGRVTAMLTALFHHDPTLRPDSADPFSLAKRFPSLSPTALRGRGERAKVVEFAQSLIYEGGYYPQEIYTLLGYTNLNAARVARQISLLDRQSNRQPSPWEVAGRVGRSGMGAVSDHWAMAAGADEAEAIPTPGTLAYLPSLAIVYALYPDDGLEAAHQLATLKDDDIRATPAAKAAYRLLAEALAAGHIDKDAWLREAAAASGDENARQDLRAVRVKDWRYLRGEECAMGRVERAVYLWYKGKGYIDTLEDGEKLLRSRESVAYLSALAAATYGPEGMPPELLANSAADRELFDLINDLYNLAGCEAVLRVLPEEYD